MGMTQQRGQAGEDAAAQFLEGRGWQILHRNWRFHHKEIDLVVARDGVVAFVEVKTRSPEGWGHPLEAIGARKRRDLAVAARGWIARHGDTYPTFRFDAVEVVLAPGVLRVDHIEDAWRL